VCPDSASNVDTTVETNKEVVDVIKLPEVIVVSGNSTATRSEKESIGGDAGAFQ
jgi:hypothetical protein